MASKHVPHKLRFWVIENPGSGYLKHYLGHPVASYSPHEYGDNYMKKTSLWGYFNMPEKTHLDIRFKEEWISNKVTPMTHKNKEERMHARSMCSQKFAQAFFEVNR